MVAECLATGKEPLMTPEHALHVVDIMCAARESQATGRRIDLQFHLQVAGDQLTCLASCSDYSSFKRRHHAAVVRGIGRHDDVGPIRLLANHVGRPPLSLSDPPRARSRCGHADRADRRLPWSASRCSPATKRAGWHVTSRYASTKPASWIAVVVGQRTAIGHFPASAIASVQSSDDGSLKSPVTKIGVASTPHRIDFCQHRRHLLSARLTGLVDRLGLGRDVRRLVVRNLQQLIRLIGRVIEVGVKHPHPPARGQLDRHAPLLRRVIHDLCRLMTPRSQSP